MQINDIFNIPEDVNIEYLKNNITEDQLLLLYWFITEYENEFPKEQLQMLYDFLYEIDDKLKNEGEDE